MPPYSPVMNEYSCFTLLFNLLLLLLLYFLFSIQNLGMYSFFLISIMQLNVERTIELTDLDDVIVNIYLFIFELDVIVICYH